jgi:hypothetical protein
VLAFLQKIDVIFLISVGNLIDIGPTEEFTNGIGRVTLQVLNFSPESWHKHSPNALAASPITPPFFQIELPERIRRWLTG